MLICQPTSGKADERRRPTEPKGSQRPPSVFKANAANAQRQQDIMPVHPFRDQSLEILRHPGGFALRVFKAFRANQGLLLAGALAYYTLLSLIPLLILLLIGLSRFIDQARLLTTL